MTAYELEPFKALIRTRCGLVFEGVGERRLAAAIAERMRTVADPGGSRYLGMLQVSEAEFRALVNLLTINETYFFREPEQIHWLVDRVVPRLLAQRGAEGRVRILSAGCSSGEEPYSVAIALHQRYGAAASQLFEIVAGDIDSDVITRAQEAFYTSFSFRAMPFALRESHFEAVDGRYRLKDAIRQMVTFRALNLIDVSAFREPAGFDLVLMRNVSIYFDVPTRKRIQEGLVTLMNDGAVLITGSTETLANDLGVLHLAEEDGHFHFVRGVPRSPQPRPPFQAMAGLAGPQAGAAWASVPKADALFAPAHRDALEGLAGAGLAGMGRVEAPVSAQGSTMLGLQAPPGPDLAALRQLVCDERYEAALRPLARWLEAAPDDVAAQLLYAFANLNRRQFTLAERIAGRVIEADPWSVDAHFLLGMSAKWQQDLAQATSWFKKAAYLCQTCWPAHYFLGGLYAAQGDERAAMRAWRGCLQLLGDDSADTGIRHLPLGLRAHEIRFLCERRLAGPQAALPAGDEVGARWR